MAANNRVQQRDRASARRRRFVSNDKTREKKDARSLEPLPSWSSETSRLRAKKRECELSETCARRAAPPFPNDVSSSELGFWVVGGAETRRRILGPTMWLFPDQHWSIVRFQSDARSGLSRYTVLHETVRIDRQSSYS